MRENYAKEGGPHKNLASHSANFSRFPLCACHIIVGHESIAAAICMLEAHEDCVDKLGLTVDDVREMLEFVTDSNYFESMDPQYRQKSGLAMGTHLAPSIAIFVHVFH